MTIQEIEKRLSEIQTEINTRGKEMTDEEFTNFQTEADGLIEQRNQYNKQQERNALLDKIASGSIAGEKIRSFDGEDDPEDKYNTVAYRKAFKDFILRKKEMPIEYRDDVSKTTDNAAVIPTTIINKIYEKMESYGGIYARVTKTSFKGGVAVPTSSAKPTATWVAEGAGSTKQKKTTNNIVFAHYKLRCAVAISLEMDTMALSAFETTVINNIVEAMMKAIESAIISGDGSSKPTGILHETPVEGQSIASDEQKYSDLVAAEAALPAAYESTSVWCMSKKTFMGYIGMVDTNKQPIARVNYGLNGRPERTLLGRQVVVYDGDGLKSFATASAGEVYAFIFNFSDYILNSNYQMTMKEYEDNETDNIIKKAIAIVDGKVVDKNSLVVLKKTGG